jgi:hypothetical protein
MADKPSETGITAQAPFNPKMGGNRKMAGIRKINCRVKLNTMAILALPMD